MVTKSYKSLSHPKNSTMTKTDFPKILKILPQHFKLTLHVYLTSVHQFENMVGRFRLDTNPKLDSDSGPPRQQEEPWMITDQDLERNKAKV